MLVQVMGAVDIKQTQEQELTLEWDSSASNDMIADSTLALIAGIDKSPASVKCLSFTLLRLHTSLTSTLIVTTNGHSHSHGPPDHPHPHADNREENAQVTRIERLAWFLEAHFGEVELHMPTDTAPEDMEQGEDAHEPSLLVRLDEADATIDLLSMVRLPDSSFCLCHDRLMEHTDRYERA